MERWGGRHTDTPRAMHLNAAPNHPSQTPPTAPRGWLRPAEPLGERRAPQNPRGHPSLRTCRHSWLPPNPQKGTGPGPQTHRASPASWVLSPAQSMAAAVPVPPGAPRSPPVPWPPAPGSPALVRSPQGSETPLQGSAAAPGRAAAARGRAPPSSRGFSCCCCSPGGAGSGGRWWGARRDPQPKGFVQREGARGTRCCRRGVGTETRSAPAASPISLGAEPFWCKNERKTPSRGL